MTVVLQAPVGRPRMKDRGLLHLRWPEEFNHGTDLEGRDVWVHYETTVENAHKVNHETILFALLPCNPGRIDICATIIRDRP